MSLAAEDVVKLTAVCYELQTGQVSLNTTFWKVLAPVTGPPGTGDFVAAMAQALSPVYRAWMPTSATFRGLIGQTVFPTNKLEVPVKNSSFAGAGTASGAMIPNQVSGLISWQGNIYYAGNTGKMIYPRGRIYPGLASTLWASTNGEMTAAGYNQLDAIRLAYGTMKTVVGTGFSFTMSMQIRTVTQAIPNPIVTYRQAVLGVSKQKWATQRRRGQFAAQNEPPV